MFIHNAHALEKPEAPLSGSALVIPAQGKATARQPGLQEKVKNSHVPLRRELSPLLLQVSCA